MLQLCSPLSHQIPALAIIKDLLEKDSTLKERTVLLVQDIIPLLEFCLKNTYFSFQGQYYEQVEGVAMESPVSPIVANLYMEYFEQKDSKYCHPSTPKIWLRYVDEHLGYSKGRNNQIFLQHINSVDPAIKFAVEGQHGRWAIPFLDTTVKPESEGKLSITLSRKPTQWTNIYNGIAIITSQLSTV